MDIRTSTNLATYQDLVDDLLDVFGEDYDRRAKKVAKRSSVEAYRAVTRRHAWSIYSGVNRISTVAPYSTGTIAYDHTAHLSGERMVTLTDGTWPTWAAFGCLLIDSRPYHVESRISDSLVTLTESLNPGADIAAGETYKLYRDTYPLPVAARSMGRLRDVVNGYKPDYVFADDWLEVVRGFTTPSLPTHYTTIGDPENYSSLAVRFAPTPDAIYVYDYTYERGLTDLRTLNDASGTVTVTAASTTVTASTAVFKSYHVGSVIRFGDTTNEPTGLGGEHPYVAQRTITAVTDTTHATINAVLDGAVTSVYYSLSDVLDIDTDVMLNLLTAESRARYIATMSMGKLVFSDEQRLQARLLRAEAEAEYIKALALDSKSSTPTPFGASLSNLPIPGTSRPFVVAGS